MNKRGQVIDRRAQNNKRAFNIWQ